MLFVVDPTCGGCLRGMDDLNKDLLATTDDPRLRTFVVHVPVIGATEKDVTPAMKLLQNAGVVVRSLSNLSVIQMPVKPAIRPKQ